MVFVKMCGWSALVMCSLSNPWLDLGLKRKCALGQTGRDLDYSVFLCIMERGGSPAVIIWALVISQSLLVSAGGTQEFNLQRTEAFLVLLKLYCSI